ncbi:MAG TPA: F0F1 ATP synthase subunit B [Balneolales bacterium]|nr:F0F1 ATP synthase subunit B [Balneolales bacterium]
MYILIARGGLLSVDPGLFFWILIVFALFIFVLTKYAWKPVLGALEERENSIKDSLDAAEKAMARAEKVSKENEAALREAELMAQKIRKEAIDEAELLRTERIEKARDEAAQLLEHARSSIEQEKKRALLELRNEVAKLAIQSASKIIDAELDVKKNTKLVESYIKELSNN